MTDDAAKLRALAGALATRIGRGAPTGLTQLAGGKNNRVFRVDFPAGPPLVLKSYFTDPRDTRNRLTAEWRFLEHAWRRGVRTIPEPLAADPEQRVALYCFVEGRKLASSEITAREVDAALAFLLAVNAPPRDPSILAPGSEACFSLAEHVATVERRVARLATLNPDAPHHDAATAIVRQQLAPAWSRVRARIMQSAAAARLQISAPLATAGLCLSPSDFGFHNALADDAGRLTFLDFEYAGRDDPAKLVCDFFCQPEIPVPLGHFERFATGLADGLALAATDLDRCRLLLDAYRIKWTCIILNDFLPLGAARRAFADQGALAARALGQLERARRKLAELAPP